MRFKDLENINDSKVSRLSKSTVIQICMKSLERCECSAYEVLHLWRTKFLGVYGLANLSDDDWMLLINSFDKMFQQMLSVKVDNVSLSSWLKECLEFLKRIPVGVESLLSFLLIMRFGLRVVVGFLEMYKKCRQCDDLKALHGCVISLLQLLLEVLSARLDSGIAGNVKEYASLIETIALLCEVIEKASDGDIRIVVEMWKCMTKLIVYCHRYSRMKGIETSMEKDENEKEGNKWARKPIVLLLLEIGRNISVVYKEETLKRPTDQVEKYLRVTSFYLKLLLQIACNLEHVEFPATEEFCETLCQAMRMPRCFENTRVYVIVEKYVQNGFRDIVKHLLKNDYMKQELLKQLEKGEIGSLDLLQLCLHACMSEHSSGLIDLNVDFFKRLYECVMRDERFFICSDKFDTIVEAYATLTLLSLTSGLENYLTQMIFSSNFYLSHSSVEVLLIVARNRREPNVLKEHFNFWRRCNERFALLSTNSKRINVRRLLKCYFELYKNCSEISDKILYEYKDETDSNNFGFCLSVGLPAICSSEESTKSLCAKFNANLLSLLMECDTGSSIESYYKIICYMMFLNSLNVIVQKELIRKVCEVLLTICRYGVQEKRQRFYIFLCEAFQLLSTGDRIDIAEDIVLSILASLNNDALNKREIWTAELFHFLNSCCTHRNAKLQDIAKSILLIPPHTKLHKIVRLMCLDNQLDRYSVTAENNELFTNIMRQSPITPLIGQSIYADASCCMVNQQCKRLRLDYEHDDNDNVKKLIQDMSKMSNKVAKLSMHLDRQDISVLKFIVCNIESFIKEK